MPSNERLTPSINVRELEEKDLATVLLWRNDTHTRAMSINTSEISWTEHTNWFVAVNNNDSYTLLLCFTDNGKDIAFVQFVSHDEYAEVSINLCPEERGKGLSKQCLEKAIHYFHTNHRTASPLFARIKNENVGSQKLFTAAGFTEYRESNGIKYYSMTDESQKGYSKPNSWAINSIR